MMEEEMELLGIPFQFLLFSTYFLDKRQDTPQAQSKAKIKNRLKSDTV